MSTEPTSGATASDAKDGQGFRHPSYADVRARLLGRKPYPPHVAARLSRLNWFGAAGIVCGTLVPVAVFLVIWTPLTVALFVVEARIMARARARRAAQKR